MVKFLSLFILVFLPILSGLLVISPFFPNQTVKIRRFAKGIIIFELLYAAIFLASVNYQTLAFQFKESLPFELIPTTGITLAFGLDSLSALMCVLTAFIALMALIAAKSSINKKHKIFYALMLILTGCIIGIFTANDIFTFFLFWELELIPMYFLISLFGGEAAKKSAMKFVIFTFTGSLFMFIAITLLYAYAYDTNTFVSIETLANQVSTMPILMQFALCTGFLIAFAVKLPIFPLHTWLADAHTNAPTPVSMMLAGVLLKTGAYGLIRFNLGAFYDVFQLLAPALILLGTINVIWASMLAIAQSDIKRIIAYSSIAHIGIILIGIASMSAIGLNGAIYQMVAHGLISAGLFMGTGVIYLKLKTRKLQLLGGLGTKMPKFMSLMLILSLAAIAVPFTMGFVGEVLCLYGAFNSPLLDTAYNLHRYIQPLTITAAISIILSAVYILRMFHHTFCSTHCDIENVAGNKNTEDTYRKNILDISGHQNTVLVTIVLAILIFGIYPMGIINIVNDFSISTVNQIQK